MRPRVRIVSTFMLGLLLNLVVAVLLAGAAVVLAGRFRWHRLTRSRLARLRRAREAGDGRFDPDVMADLPDPVRAYLAKVLGPGQPVIRAARMEHLGTLRMGRSANGWRAFRSEQTVTVFPPGMLWNATVRMNAALSARVHDTYAAGRGTLHATLLGLVTVASQTDSRALSEAELMRWLAEAVWYPTALLPRPGLTWQAVDGRTARARIVDGDLSAELDFGFGEDGLVESVRSPSRYRGERGGEAVFHPWCGRFRSYGRWGGMLIPVEAEVSWTADGVDQPYWRGRLQAIDFDLGS